MLSTHIQSVTVMARTTSLRYKKLLELLRAARVKSGLSQEDVAARLREFQSYVSKCERGTRRMDVVDLIDYLAAIGRAPESFIQDLVAALKSAKGRRKRTR